MYKETECTYNIPSPPYTVTARPLKSISDILPGRTGVINDGILFAPALPDPGTVLLKDVLDVGQLLKLSDIPGKILLQLSSS